MATTQFWCRVPSVLLMSLIVTGSISAQINSNQINSDPNESRNAALRPGEDPQPAEDSKSASTSDTRSNLSADETDLAPSAPEPQERPKRTLGIVPDFENAAPLTVREKFVLSMHESFDVSAHLGNLFQATEQQALDGQPHYGQGWDAYGKRFVANEADQITGSVLIYGVLPSLLHQDPRYFRRSKGSFASRVWYAVSRTVVTRTDNGAAAFNTSETLGQLISCGISLSYYPQQDRTVSRLLSNWGVNLAGNSGYNALAEYYPDMMRAVFRRHKKPASQNGN